MPLLEAYRSMQAARELLAQGETGEATRAAQRRAVDLLDQMIQAASPPPSTTSPQPQPAPGEPGSSASGQPEAGQPPSEQQRPGDEGDEEPGGAESEQEGSASGGPGQPAGTVPAAGAGTARGIRPDGAGAAVWGHLPERTRGMLRSEMPTEYLPQYATEISEYFRQLAEMKPDE